MDNVEIRCEVQRELSGKLSPQRHPERSAKLQHRIKTIIGISTKVTVMEHEAIPRTLTGKAKRVLDERPKRPAPSPCQGRSAPP
jgi:phenylacetate-CoA ligase